MQLGIHPMGRVRWSTKTVNASVSGSAFECGGQGRNRTADASLFRAVGSITYRPVYRVFITLRALNLVSGWTPGRSPVGVGLHVDSDIPGRFVESSHVDSGFPGAGIPRASRVRAVAAIAI